LVEHFPALLVPGLDIYELFLQPLNILGHGRPQSLLIDIYSIAFELMNSLLKQFLLLLKSSNRTIVISSWWGRRWR
jgi:hypothetical protein